MMDNYDLYMAHERDQERWLRSRPVCPACGEPIQEDYYIELDDGNLCQECAERWLRNRRRVIWAN